MKRIRKSGRAVVLALALVAGLWRAGDASATVMVEATVTPLAGGVFHYDLAVVNASILDLFLVTIVDMPLADPLIDGTLTSPAGFLASYDGGLGFLDLLGDITAEFPLGRTEPFAFDSLAGPASFMAFEAFDLAGFPVPAVTGTLTFIIVDVPEAVTASLFAVGLALLPIALRRSDKPQSKTN